MAALKRIRKGDFQVRITSERDGLAGAVADVFNDVAEMLEDSSTELARVGHAVGKEGKTKQRISLLGAGGGWAANLDNINTLIEDLVQPTEEVSRVIGAVAKGDLSQRISLERDGTPLKGEFLRIGKTVNRMVDQLSSFASEVTRVAKEVGTEGRLGGQADVKGVAGTWKALTDSVNSMGGNLTNQVRGIAKVVTAVANGDLKRKLVLEARGEIAALADTIKSMIETLDTFADQVTTVAREVGVEGKLGGQAKVPGAAGTWKQLTDNVNQLAANLTSQVRAIADVATAVTKGDLTRHITVEAQGEVAALKDHINKMIRNLKETTQKNNEQDWLKTNIAKFSRMLQGQRDLLTVTKLTLSEIAPMVSAQHAVFYMSEQHPSGITLVRRSSYGLKKCAALPESFELGEGLVGQCGQEKRCIFLNDVPQDYVKISSGLGEGAPLNIVVLPVLFEDQVMGVIELASFNRFNDISLTLLGQLTETIGVVLNTIQANMRTEDLLKQSQKLAEELQSQQEELKETNTRLERQAESLRASEELLRSRQQELKQANEDLEEKAQQLFQQKAEVESKNREIELAKLAIQERAEQLALTSKYKSEFLANMSHELRTPLNSLLILAEALADNEESNLSSKQVEFARTIYGAGADLLSLINDILDMAKIESGTMTIEQSEVPSRDILDYVERTFRPVADSKNLVFETELAEGLPALIVTDLKRLQQVLRNLLSNAFKFTERGRVALSIRLATSGWSIDNQHLNQAESWSPSR